MLLHILAVGDVVGEGGQDILSRRLREIQEREDIHFTVVNGENASGVGITPRQARGILEAGAVALLQTLRRLKSVHLR